jgi:hypothetical protein
MGCGVIPLKEGASVRPTARLVKQAASTRLAGKTPSWTVEKQLRPVVFSEIFALE